MPNGVKRVEAWKQKCCERDEGNEEEGKNAERKRKKVLEEIVV